MLRDPNGPFRFMDIYLFVQTREGTEKLTYVKKAVHAGKAYFIGSGIYVE